VCPGYKTVLLLGGCFNMCYRSPSGAMCSIASLVLQASGGCPRRRDQRTILPVLRHGAEIIFWVPSVTGELVSAASAKRNARLCSEIHAGESHLSHRLVGQLHSAFAERATVTHQECLSIVYQFVDSSRHLSHMHSNPHTPFNLSLLSDTVKSFSSPPR
jgi:hypothetical protein